MWPCCSFLRLLIFSLFYPTFSWWSWIKEVFAQILTKIAKKWRCYLKNCEKSPKFVTKICWAVDVVEVQRNANLIDLVKSFQTSIYLQNLASIQPRTFFDDLSGIRTAPRTSHLIFIIWAASRDSIFIEATSPSAGSMSKSTRVRSETLQR